MASKGRSKQKATSSSCSTSSSSSTNASSLSTTNSACVIIPPFELWDSIQEIRSANDTSFERWPPHINLLWPFVPQTHFNDAATQIQSHPEFQSLKSFKIRLSRFSYTPGSRYVHLIADILDSEGEILEWPPEARGKKKNQPLPYNPIQHLYKILMELFPQCERISKDGQGVESPHFLPHLSVGQYEQPTIRETVSKLQETWNPIEFEVNEIIFLGRSGSNSAFQNFHQLGFTESQ